MVGVRVQVLVVLSCVTLAMLGRMPESSGGWATCAPVPAIGVARYRYRRGERRERERRGGGWRYVIGSWRVPVARSLAVWGMWLISGGRGPGWLVWLPWVLWLWQSVGRLWPKLRLEPEWGLVGWVLWQGQRLALVGYLGLAVGEVLREGAGNVALVRLETGEACTALALGLGCSVCGGQERRVRVERQADGSYRAELCGHFSMQVAGDDPFRVRVLMLALRLLEEVGPQRRGGRTRDGRAPFVRQVQVAEWFDMPQPNVSRIEGYWLAGDWPNLLSLKSEAVLTPELRDRVVQAFAAFPWWRMEKV
jgi:hypothetical protein